MTLDLRWIDATYRIADCLTKHASRKSEAVLQKVLHEEWRITAEEDLLDRRKREREIRNSYSCDEESWPMGKKNFEECKSGCASNGITDVLTNLLMKVQRDAVSENKIHNFSVSLRS